VEKPNVTQARPTARVEKLRRVSTEVVIEDREREDENVRTESESFVESVIIDSWIDPAPPADAGTRLVLQVAPLGHPQDLVIIEAEASIVSDRLWLEDLSENLCLGIPVLAMGSRSLNGRFAATRLKLTR
jgi:hypothetical protein